MKGISLSMQIECACGQLLTHDHSSTGMGNTLPMIQQFTVACACGLKYFTHVQESKADARKA